MREYQEPSQEQIDQANDEIRYLGYSVFAASGDLPEGDRQQLAGEVLEQLDELKAEGLTVRGTYDVSALRADADTMFWWIAPKVETLQKAYSIVRRSTLGAILEPVWSVVGLHRPAEFNRRHIPAFMTDETPLDYLCVYPFVRSYDWYILKAEDRSKMLRDHGMAAAGYKDIKAHTVSSFALGDYEFLLGFEADQLHRLVDMMRDLRATEARLHVREEIPFYTGPRRELADIIADWR